MTSLGTQRGDGAASNIGATMWRSFPRHPGAHARQQSVLLTDRIDARSQHSASVLPPRVKGLLALMAVFATAPSARPIDCWVDLFNGSDFTGKQERIYGPLELANLSNIRGFDWNDAIESVEVGPGAEVTLYRRENFFVPEVPLNHAPELKAWNFEDENYRSGAVTFTQGHRVHHLGEYQLHRQVSSLKVICGH